MRTNLFKSLCRGLGILAIALVAFIPANAVVTQLGAASTATLTNTLSFTIPAGNNRLLIVTTADDQSLDIVSVSFGASAMIQRAERNDNFAVDSIWSFNAGSGGATTATITVLSAGPSPNQVTFIGAVAFQGVDQTNPVTGALTNQSFTNPSASTLNVTSPTGNLVFDVFDVFRGSAAATGVTPAGSQTAVHSPAAVTLPSGGNGIYRTTTRPGAGSTAMSWTTTDGEALLHLAVNLVAVPTAAGVTVSGRIVTAKGAGIRNVTVLMTDSNGNTRRATTGTFGYYSFDDVGTGATYTMTVISKKFSFNDPVRVINVSDNVTDFDWVAE